MTEPAAPFKEPEFHARQRARLCNPRLMPPLGGGWAEALKGQLQTQVPQHVQPPYDQQSVVDCFATAPVADVERLFHALVKACQQVPNLDEGSAIWATELTVYATFRVLDTRAWAGLPAWQGSGGTAHAAWHEVPEMGALVASLGLAMLTGRFVRLKEGGRPRGVFDLSNTPLRTDPVPVLLAALYDQVFQAQAPRLNADAALTRDEMGQLQTEFTSYRLERELAAPYILLPHLDSATRVDVQNRFSEALNATVLSGQAVDDAGLVQLQAQFTTASLKATVEKIFRLLPQLGSRKEPNPRAASGVPEAGTSPSTATAVSAGAGPVRSGPARAYTWDVFISHTTEDKAPFVNGLANALKAAGLRVWYDSGELAVGDSLRRAIGAGLRESRFGVVVLSPRYLALGKGWAQGELDTLLTYEFNGGATRVLPVWLDLNRQDVERMAPMLAGKLAVDAGQGLPAVVAALLTAINRGS